MTGSATTAKGDNVIEPPRRPAPAAYEHPDRALAQAEIHARPISLLRAPARVRRVALLLGQDLKAAQQARARIIAFCTANGIEPPASGARRFGFDIPSRQVSWEFHTEFYTVTWTSPFDDAEPWPSGIGLEAVADDKVAMAVRVDIVAAPVIPDSALAGFDELSLCYSDIEGGRAQVATDFLVDALGYTRYEVAAGMVGPYLLGSIVRRLLEIETYRVLALIGIALGRSVSPTLGSLETRLSEAMQKIGLATNAAESTALLETLHDLQVEAAHTVERTRYRFGASHAYGDILRQRLADLDEHATGEHRTLQRYLSRRVGPALATFKALEQRQGALFDQMARSTALLGTRINLDIETQNRTILETISETAKSQYRLQGTVEGLSTIAISYYFLGILSYASHALEPAYEHQKTIAIAILAPVIVVAVWLYLRRTSRH